MRNPVSRGRKNNLDAALGYQAIVLHAGNRGVGKGCLVDWTIPIHARTLGVSVPPQEMGMYYRVVRPYSTNRFVASTN